MIKKQHKIFISELRIMSVEYRSKEITKCPTLIKKKKKTHLNIGNFVKNNMIYFLTPVRRKRHSLEENKRIQNQNGTGLFN